MSKKNITVEAVIARVNASHMPPLRKEFQIQVAKDNADRPEELEYIFACVNNYDVEFEKNQKTRMEMSFNVNTDCWEAPAPDMTKNKESAKEMKENKAASVEFWSEKDENCYEDARPERGTEGKHTVIPVSFEFESNPAKNGFGWGKLMLEDENRFLYQQTVWCCKEPKKDAVYTTDDGKEINYSEKLMLNKIVDYITGYNANGQHNDRAFNAIKLEGKNPMKRIKELVEKKIAIECEMVRKESFETSAKEFRIYYSNVVGDTAEGEVRYGGLFSEDDEDVSYNDAIDSRVKNNYAPRPTEDAAC